MEAYPRRRYRGQVRELRATEGIVKVEKTPGIVSRRFRLAERRVVSVRAGDARAPAVQ